MNTTLKTLKETKGIKKEFSFITPLTELIQKEYEDLVPLMDVDTYGVAIDEVLEKYEFLAKYSELNEISTLAFNKRFEYNISDIKSKKSEENNLVKNFKASLPSFNSDPTVTLNRKDYSWGTYNIKITDLYVITDEKAFEEFALAYMILKEDQAIKRAKENTKTLKKENDDESARTKLYGKRYKHKSNSKLAIDLLDILDIKDTKEKFEKTTELITNIIDESADNDRW